MKSAGKEVGTLTGMIAGATAAAVEFAAKLAEEAVAAMAEFIKEADQAIDRAAKLSDTLNTTVQSVRELEYSMRIAGGTADEMHMALEKMVHTLGDGKADAALRKLGLNARELSKEDAGKAFQQIADKIRELKSPADQAAAAFEIFHVKGESGAALLNLINSNVEATNARFDQLAGELDRFDAANVEVMNQAFVDMKAIMEGVASVIVSQLAPLVRGLADEFVLNAEDAAEWRDIASGACQIVIKAVEAVVWVMRPLIAGWHLFKGVVIEAVTAAVGALTILGKAVDYVYEKLTGKHLGLSDGMGAMVSSLQQSANKEFGAAFENEMKFFTAADFRSGGGGVQSHIEQAQARAQTIVDKSDARHKAAFDHPSTGMFGEKQHQGGQMQHLASASTFTAALIDRMKHTSQGGDLQHQQLNEAKKMNATLVQLLRKTPQAAVMGA